MHPRLGMGWARKGAPLPVPTMSRHHERLNVSGWVAAFRRNTRPESPGIRTDGTGRYDGLPEDLG